MKAILSLFLLGAVVALKVHAFAPSSSFGLTTTTTVTARARTTAVVSVASSDDDFLTDDATQERIKALVEEHPVLLFMKGSKLFPQCGFSNTATQILQSFNIDFHTVDVLAGSFGVEMHELLDSVFVNSAFLGCYL